MRRNIMLRFTILFFFISTVAFNAFGLKDHSALSNDYKCPDPKIINQFIKNELRAYGRFFISDNGHEFYFSIPRESSIKEAKELQHTVLRETHPSSYKYTCVYKTNVPHTSLALTAQFSGKECHLPKKKIHENNFHCTKPMDCRVTCKERFLAPPK